MKGAEWSHNELVFLCVRHEQPGDAVDYRDATGRSVPPVDGSAVIVHRLASIPAPAAPEGPGSASLHGPATDWVTTAIHVPRDVLILLRRVAVERANLGGGRPSVSAVLVDLVRANSAALEKETGR